MSEVFLGWVHHTDGTSIATKWFSLLLMPLIPLGSYRVVVHPSRPVQGHTVAIAPEHVVGWIIPPKVEVLGNVALDIRGIIRTYALYWLLLPMAIAAPFLIDILLTNLISGGSTFITESMAPLIHLVLLFIGLALIIAGVIWLMLRTKPKCKPYLKAKT